MSALAPVPRPEPESTAEVELGAELDGLRRRADDQAALLRKHQAAVTQLADSVAALVALGKKRNRWINLNSFVAYVLFTVLLGGAMFVLYRTRVGELEARRAQAVAERDLARGAPAAATSAHDDAAAAALYALIKAGDDGGLIASEAQVASAALTATERAVFTDAIAAARARVAGDAPRPTGGGADDGVAKWKTGAWTEAAPALERAIAADPQAARAAQLRYYLGVARWKLGDHRAAADQLERALGGRLDAAASDARYFLAASLDRLGDTDRARVEYDRFATAFPQNQYAVFARRRSSVLQRRARAAQGGAARPPAAEPADDTATPPGPTPEPATAPAPADVSPAPTTTPGKPASGLDPAPPP